MSLKKIVLGTLFVCIVGASCWFGISYGSEQDPFQDSSSGMWLASGSSASCPTGYICSDWCLLEEGPVGPEITARTQTCCIPDHLVETSDESACTPENIR